MKRSGVFTQSDVERAVEEVCIIADEYEPMAAASVLQQVAAKLVRYAEQTIQEESSTQDKT